MTKVQHGLAQVAGSWAEFGRVPNSLANPPRSRAKFGQGRLRSVHARTSSPRAIVKQLRNSRPTAGAAETDLASHVRACLRALRHSLRQCFCSVLALRDNARRLTQIWLNLSRMCLKPRRCWSGTAHMWPNLAHVCRTQPQFGDPGRNSIGVVQI